jgi:hypothetical protein
MIGSQVDKGIWDDFMANQTLTPARHFLNGWPKQILVWKLQNANWTEEIKSRNPDLIATFFMLKLNVHRNLSFLLYRSGLSHNLFQAGTLWDQELRSVQQQLLHNVETSLERLHKMYNHNLAIGKEENWGLILKGK